MLQRDPPARPKQQLTRQDSLQQTDSQQNGPAPASNETRTQRFWLGQLYAGLVGYAVTLTTVLGYVAMTPSQLHRGWIVLGALPISVCLLGCYGLRHRLVTARWRMVFFGAWNIITFALISLFCLLDGGVTSWLTALWLLPMLYLAIAYPPRAVMVCGVSGLAIYMLLAALSPSPVPLPAVLLQGMALLVGWLLAVLGAVVREQQERDLHRLRRRLEVAAATDALTGCLNQRAFMTALRQEIARSARQKHCVALLLIDIDHFKRVNDTYGHPMGDAVLRHVGTVLRQISRQADVAGRPGGDELALLLPETGHATACKMAERLRAATRSQLAPIEITLSIGICASVPEAEPMASLFRRADQALYTAKNRGRDQVAVCDEAAAVAR